MGSKDNNKLDFVCDPGYDAESENIEHIDRKMMTCIPTVKNIE